MKTLRGMRGRSGAARYAAAVVCVASFASCRPEPEMVFVPSAGFEEELYVTSQRGRNVRLRVGESLVLNVARRSGPWKPMPRDGLADDACWLRSLPIELEEEVADNVRWTVEPDSVATFNVQPMPDRSREVRFDRPGRYVLRAESASHCGEAFAGTPILVEVVEG